MLAFQKILRTHYMNDPSPVSNARLYILTSRYNALGRVRLLMHCNF